MASPFFSIIIPTYNSERTIESCLRQIFHQTCSDFEVWVIDGQSTDKTIQILQIYQAQYPNFHFLSEEDNGIYDAMNKGISLAVGEWLYFLGSDDLLYNASVLEKVRAILELSDSRVVYGDVLIDGHAGWAESGTVYDGYFDIQKLLYKNICHQSIFYHSSIFNQYGYYNIHYPICADYDYNLLLSSKTKFKYINLIIAVFKGGNASFLERDLAFEHDKILNIVKYFKFQLYSRAFRNQQIFLRTAIGVCYRKKKYFYFFLSLSANIYQYFMKLYGFN